MAGHIKHYFACGNTSKGFRNYFDSNLNTLHKIYILKGGPGTGKSSLMKHIGKTLADQNFDVEYIHCSSDADSLDGVVVRSLSLAIVDGTAPHVIEPKAPGAIEEYINLGTAWNIDTLSTRTENILNLQRDISSCYPKAYSEFAKALAIHDDWEKIYIQEMNFDEANKLTQELITKLIGNVQYDKSSTTMHRFFGASTPNGPMDFIENLTSSISTRYFMKGRPGSGKSTILKKIMKQATLQGIDMEVYHCAFDPDSLDMLIFPELDLCIFDSTAPHEYYPSKDTDQIIDLYPRLITPGTDEKNKEALVHLAKSYKDTVKSGTSYLALAKKLHDQLESYYIQSTDFSVVDSIVEDLLNKITSKISH